MAKRSAVLLLVLVSCCVCLSMSIEVKRSRSNLIAGETTSCTTNEKDKDIMEDCLKKYKLGFDNLEPYIPGSDPPSCAVDLGLAQCLSRSRCFGKIHTNALRLLIFNQLVFTARVRLCVHNDFQELLNEAKTENENLDQSFGRDLKKITEMNNMEPDSCATLVYGACGKNFTTELRKDSGYNATKLCNVFDQEGDCIYSAAKTNSCYSDILKRFKENSDAAARVVLCAICPCPSNDIREELSNKKRQDKLFSLKKYLESKRDNPVNQ